MPMPTPRSCCEVLRAVPGAKDGKDQLPLPDVDFGQGNEALKDSSLLLWLKHHPRKPAPSLDLTASGGQEVTLHIYHIGPLARMANIWARTRGLGAFHVGVEILGIEWSFQGIQGLEQGDHTTGVTAREPRSHPRHIYSESLPLGESPLSLNEVGYALECLINTWPASSYHFSRHNCIDFAEALASKLQAPEDFPKWVHGAAKSSLLPELHSYSIFTMCHSEGGGCCDSARCSQSCSQDRGERDAMDVVLQLHKSNILPGSPVERSAESASRRSSDDAL